MPITSYFTKNNRQMAFSYNPISMVRAGKPESFFIVISLKFLLAFKNEESLLISLLYFRSLTLFLFSSGSM